MCRSWWLVVVLCACGAAKTSPPPPTPPAIAAPAPGDPITPLDPQIKVGHLANGLTYYVMKHGKPEQRASLWLAVNAGSVLEDDDQRGLAHFVEHMAFNGTKRFPKQDIVDFIEKVGMEFGADVNAYTSFDQTVYQLTVPTDDPATLIKGVDILRDWAGDITFDPGEVDKERGVVLEEWRLGRGAAARIEDKQWPVVFAGSKYAERLVIGLPEIIKTAKRDTLYRFYKDWYRPDNMAVIAVGDFDPAQLEKELQRRFGDLQNPAQERPRVVVPVPHDQPTAVTVATDPELPSTQVTIYDKLDHRREATKGDYRRYLVEGLYHQMLGARFSELAQEPDAPFLFAGSMTGSFVRASDLFTRQAQAKEGKVREALAAVVKEIVRVDKFGFAASELDRARRRVLAETEKDALEWDKVPDTDLADEITRNFFTGEQMGGRAVELAYTREMLPTITLAELDHLAQAWANEKGRVIAMSGPASSQLPSEPEIRKIFATAEAAPVEPWQDTGADKPLLAHVPAPGSIVTETHDAEVDATVWTLSNGAKVIVKPTPFKNDEVLFDGWQPGGTSLLSDADYHQVRFFGLISSMGAGELDPIALDKVLSGHVADVSAGYSELAEIVGGTTRPADLEVMMQLAFLRMTEPRKDARAFAAWQRDQLELVKHRAVTPEGQFWDAMTAIETTNHPRHLPETEAELAGVDPEKALAVSHSRFSEFGGFTFVFVGNIDPKTLKPLVETYLASLPSTGKRPHWKDIGVHWATGPIEKTIVAGTEPKSFVSLTSVAPDAWSLDGERDAEVLTKVLEIRLREVLREDMGGVYGVTVNAALAKEPTPRREFEVMFGCDPQNVDKLKQAVFAELARIGKEGVGESYLAKVREQLRREHETNVKDNQWWVQAIHEAYWSGENFTAITDANAEIKRTTSTNVQAAARRFFDPKHYVLGVMKPRATAP
ncbi:MAG TPA: insulinase family protein [Kofleriaceae bacterium]|nr:insulinase family protein [Kofleriaceae bacterium]